MSFQQNWRNRSLEIRTRGSLQAPPIHGVTFLHCSTPRFRECRIDHRARGPYGNIPAGALPPSLWAGKRRRHLPAAPLGKGCRFWPRDSPDARLKRSIRGPRFYAYFARTTAISTHAPKPPKPPPQHISWKKQVYPAASAERKNQKNGMRLE